MSVNQERRNEFLAYTESRLEKPELLDRFNSLKKSCELFLPGDAKRVLDVGCGMGVQSLLWSGDNYEVTGIDIDSDLIDIAKKNADDASLNVEWDVGSADVLPYADEEFDVCLSVELLEHVPQWRKCVYEFCRVVKPGGALMLTTTNSICPKQSEFRLPAYSWWPKTAKRWAENKARTTKPEFANFTDYPAVNWFTYYKLRRVLNEEGFDTYDRFDAIDTSGMPFFKSLPLEAAKKFQPLRALLYLLVEGTIVFAKKRTS